MGRIVAVPPTAISAGTASSQIGTVVFSNSNGVSFGLSGSTVTASVFATAAAAINISAGTTSSNVSAVTFANSHNISFGFDGTNVTASASAASFQGSINFSAGTTSNNLSAVVLSNSNNVSFGLNNGTFTASASIAGSSISLFSQDADFVTNFPVSQAALSVQKLSFPMNLTATQLGLVAALSCPLGSSGAVTIQHGVYTINDGTAFLASSASRSFSWTSGTATTATSLYGGASGTRYRTVAVNYALTPGDYLFVWMISTSNSGTLNVFGRAGLNIVGTYDGFETARFLNGISVSSVAALPASIVATDTGYARTGFSAMRQPGGILAGA